MQAEFREKEFENLINFELLEGSNLIYTPDQVLESIIGFDAALFTNNSDFWNIYYSRNDYYNLFNQNNLFLNSNYSIRQNIVYENFNTFSKIMRFLFQNKPILNGIFLSQNFWNELETNFNYFPKIKFNVIIQYKRPEYVNSTNAKEWYAWGQPYFRYKLDNNQQNALALLENRIAKSGLVVYACPAFYTRSQLFNFQINKVLILNTNFCQPSKLIHHFKYTFISSGYTGKAFSKFNEIKNYDFINEIKSLKEKTETSENKLHLEELNDILMEFVNKSDFYKNYFYRISNKFETKNNGVKIMNLIRNIMIFKYITKTNIMFG
jgi:hypothetical protein